MTKRDNELAIARIAGYHEDKQRFTRLVIEYGDRRIVVNATGGYDLEALVDGIGWVLDNDADIPDHVIEAHLESAIKALQKAASPGGMMKYAWKEAVKQANS